MAPCSVLDPGTMGTSRSRSIIVGKMPLSESRKNTNSPRARATSALRARLGPLLVRACHSIAGRNGCSSKKPFTESMDRSVDASSHMSTSSCP